MAYTNFKPTIWSKYIQRELGKFTVFERDCNYDFQGEVGKGKTVKILGIARPTVGDYTGADINAPEVVADSGQLLEINQAKYFNFIVDDVDKAQSIEGLMPALMEESTKAMAQARDTFIATTIGQNTDASASASTAIATKDDVKGLIDAGMQVLMNNGVDIQRDNVDIYLSPKAAMLFNDYLITTKTDNDDLVARGFLGKYLGARVKWSNNFYNDGTDDYMFIKTRKAFAFASGIDEVEAYRPEARFADAVKGLNVFGGKVIRPEELYIIKAH